VKKVNKAQSLTYTEACEEHVETFTINKHLTVAGRFI